MESRLSMTKWTATAASIWIQCFGGASYTFNIYSSALKSSQGYDQSTLDTVSVFKDIGANVGILYSVVALNCRGRFGGPWVVHVAGAAQCFANSIPIRTDSKSPQEMKGGTVQINWHDSKPVLTLDFHPNSARSPLAAPITTSSNARAE